MRKNGNIAILGSLALLVVGILFIGLKSGPETDESLSDSNSNSGTRQSATATNLRDVVRNLNTAPKKERAALVSTGVRIAKQRLAELTALSKLNPSRALANMMTLDQLAALPPEIREFSEQPFSAIGSIDLQWLTTIGEDGKLKCEHQNVAIVGDNTWQIAGPEFLSARQPIVGIPLNGYLLGEILILEKSSVKTLSSTELAVAEDFHPKAADAGIDPVSGVSADPSVGAIIGGELHFFENTATVEYVSDTLADAEAIASNSKTDRTLAHGFKWLQVAADSGSGNNGSVVQATPFLSDTINVLFIRASFPDSGDKPVSQKELEDSLLETKGHVEKYSYGTATVNFTVSPDVYELTTSSFTAATAPGQTGSDTIIAEARAAAQLPTINTPDGYNLGNYNVVAVYFPSLSGIIGSNITYGGLATVGGVNHWINGVPKQNQVEILLHEFGHNYGLFHANYFHPARLIAGDYLNPDGIPDPNGVSLEYGDIFDRMGEGSTEKGYFSPYATFRLGWMPGAKVSQPTSSETIRVHRFDDPGAKNNDKLAIRIPMGGERYNWVALRQLYTDTANRAYVVGEGILKDRPNLIDTTPGNPQVGTLDRNNAALPVGQNFYDAAAGVRITNILSGGAAPNEYIDVRVDFDPRMELQSTNVIVDESGGNAALVITRGFNSTGACSVNYSTTAGTATADADYYTTSGTVSWANGDSTPKTVYVPIRPDSATEGSENFTFTLSSPSNGVVPPLRSVATVTILDAGNKIAGFDAPFFNFTIEAIAPLPNGKVLAAGSISVGLSGNIVRFNADGSEDTTFQKGLGFNNTVKALFLQADGKVIVGGDFTNYNGTPCNRITRLNSDGTIDTDFNTAIGTGANTGNGGINAIVLEQSGSILVGGGFTNFNGTAAQGLIRISNTGATLNTLTTTFRVTSNIVKAILTQADGKIMVGGSLSYDFQNGFGFRFGIARLNENGSRDSTFEPGYGCHFADQPTPVDPPEGFVPQDGRFVNAQSETIVRQANGNYIIGGGFTRYNESIAKRIVGLLPNGSINTSFTPPTIENGLGDGIFSLQGNVLEITILPTGTVVAGGSFTSPAGRVIALQENGMSSTKFNLAGGTTGSSVRSFATDSLGNLFIGGNFFNFAGSNSRPIVKVAGGLDSLTLWKNSQFTAVQIAAGKTGAEEDFDNDGILNITEMALGTSPTVANSPQTFAIAAQNLSIQTGSGSDFLRATMQRSANNVGVWLVAQFSSDLTTWLPANPIPGANSVYDVMESTSTRFTVKDKTAVSPGAKRFVRFRAVVPN